MLFDNEQLNIVQLHRVITYSSKQQKHSYPPQLPTHELMIYLEGESIVRFHGKCIHMTEGDILYLPKGIENTEYEVEVIRPFLLHNIYFDTSSSLPREAVQIPSKGEDMRPLFERLCRTWVNKRDGYYYRSMQLTYELIEALRRAQQRYSPNRKFEVLSPAEEYLAEHYLDADFDYGELVRRSGLSYSYFKKLFIDKYGCPPVKHVTHLKLARACELLQSGSFSITRVATLCGFDNLYYFSNVFKKHFGVSPKYYGGSDL